jgi:hypothetical protein
LIKVLIPSIILLEWLIKSLVPRSSKDVVTSGVFSEEEVIMRDQLLELIYSQSRLFYNFFPDAPRSILDKTRENSGPHADGNIGSTQVNLVDQLSNQLHQLSIQQTAASQTSSSTAPPTQSSDVHGVQLKNWKAN